MKGKEVDPERKAEPPAADRAKDDIVKEKAGHGVRLKIQKSGFYPKRREGLDSIDRIDYFYGPIPSF